MKGMLFGNKPSFGTIYQAILDFKDELRERELYGKDTHSRNRPLNRQISDASQRSATKAVPFTNFPSRPGKELDL